MSGITDIFVDRFSQPNPESGCSHAVWRRICYLPRDGYSPAALNWSSALGIRYWAVAPLSIKRDQAQQRTLWRSRRFHPPWSNRYKRSESPQSSIAQLWKRHSAYWRYAEQLTSKVSFCAADDGILWQPRAAYFARRLMQPQPTISRTYPVVR